jgi:hypothetical protein
VLLRCSEEDGGTELVFAMGWGSRWYVVMSLSGCSLSGVSTVSGITGIMWCVVS